MLSGGNNSHHSGANSVQPITMQSSLNNPSGAPAMHGQAQVYTAQHSEYGWHQK